MLEQRSAIFALIHDELYFFRYLPADSIAGVSRKFRCSDGDGEVIHAESFLHIIETRASVCCCEFHTQKVHFFQGFDKFYPTVPIFGPGQGSASG